MFKKVKRKAENSKSWRCFVNRVRYIIDQMHPHHKIKKVVQAAINFGCLWGQTGKDFIQAVHESQELGEIRSKNRKGGGNPTEDIFFELIYSAPKGLRTTVEQRGVIDQKITAPFRNCPIRRGWHLAAWDLEEAERPKNWKPLDEAHYLFSARDVFGNATISSRFGDGRETLESWMRRMDEEICDMLSRNREVQFEPVHVIHRRNLGAKLGTPLTKLHELIAHHTAKPVTRENLVDVIRQLGHQADPIGDDDKVVWVTFLGRQTKRRYRIKKLLLEVAEVQLDIQDDSGEEGSGRRASIKPSPVKPATAVAVVKPSAPKPRPKPSEPDLEIE